MPLTNEHSCIIPKVGNHLKLVNGPVSVLSIDACSHCRVGKIAELAMHWLAHQIGGGIQFSVSYTHFIIELWSQV